MVPSGATRCELVPNTVLRIRLRVRAMVKVRVRVTIRVSVGICLTSALNLAHCFDFLPRRSARGPFVGVGRQGQRSVPGLVSVVVFALALAGYGYAYGYRYSYG